MQQNNNQINEQLELQQQIAQLEAMVKPYLSKEALQRYGTLKTAYPEKAIQAIVVISQLIQSGQMNGVLDDQDFVGLLKQMDGEKKEFRITRK